MEQKIFPALCAAMEELNAIGKDSKNQQQGFMYRGIDAVMNALNPVLKKNKIFVVPEVLEHSREERQTQRGGNLIYSILKVKYTFFADDGSNVSAVVIGEGMDSADKSSNKAMSVAFKYACFQVLCIPTEEMKDPDSESPPESTRKPIDPVFSKCEVCGGAIKGIKLPSGETLTGQQVADRIKASHGRIICGKCQKAQAEPTDEK